MRFQIVEDSLLQLGLVGLLSIGRIRVNPEVQRVDLVRLRLRGLLGPAVQHVEEHACRDTRSLDGSDHGLSARRRSLHAHRLYLLLSDRVSRLTVHDAQSVRPDASPPVEHVDQRRPVARPRFTLRSRRARLGVLAIELVLLFEIVPGKAITLIYHCLGEHMRRRAPLVAAM